MMVLVILVETTTPLKEIIQIFGSILNDLSSDVDISGEGALFVNVVSFDGFLWSSESQADALVVSNTLCGFFGKEFLVS